MGIRSNNATRKRRTCCHAATLKVYLAEMRTCNRRGWGMRGEGRNYWGPGPDSVAHVFVSLGSNITCPLYQLTLSHQAHVTPPDPLGSSVCSDIAWRSSIYISSEFDANTLEVPLYTLTLYKGTNCFILSLMTVYQLQIPLSKKYQ